MKLTTKKYIREGKYTPTEIQQLKIERREKLRKKQLHTEFATIYFINHGLHGYEKKSRHQIAKDLMISTTKVDIAIRDYKNYLNSLTSAEYETLINTTTCEI